MRSRDRHEERPHRRTRLGRTGARSTAGRIYARAHRRDPTSAGVGFDEIRKVCTRSCARRGFIEAAGRRCDRLCPPEGRTGMARRHRCAFPGDCQGGGFGDGISTRRRTRSCPGILGMRDGSASASEIASNIASGEITARAVIDATLARIAVINPKVNAFTDITAERARQSAEALDARRARGETLGALAGVPFAVKNLIDVAGLPTRAGSKINRDLPPATRDAMLVRRLEAAGAVLVGALNMGEYAYDFTGENVHDGPSRNPHGLDHMTGGSSGRSGAAGAARLVPLALGSDANGPVRLPFALR